MSVGQPCDWKWPHVTKCIYSCVVGLRLGSILLLLLLLKCKDLHGINKMACRTLVEGSIQETMEWSHLTHRHRQEGALGARAPPGQRKNFVGPNLQRKVVSAPQHRVRVPIFVGNFCLAVEIRRGVVNLPVLACVLRAMTKKRSSTRQLCWRKSAPPVCLTALFSLTTLCNALLVYLVGSAL